MERRFGIAAYDYWEGYSAAQIDLMVMDCPVIDYGYDKGKKRGSMMASRAEVNELDELSEAWKKKRNGKTFVGQEFSLDGFVKGEV